MIGRSRYQNVTEMAWPNPVTRPAGADQNRAQLGSTDALTPLYPSSRPRWRSLPRSLDSVIDRHMSRGLMISANGVWRNTHRVLDGVISDRGGAARDGARL